MKCVGNCAVCTLEVDKMACCLVQLLRNSIEIKRMLREQGKAEACNVFKGLEKIESEGIGEIGLDVPGTDETDEMVNGEQ